MRPIFEIGGAEAIESLPDEQREQLLHAALAALSEAQKQSNELRHQLRNTMKTAGLTEDS
jgi:TRAP-type C4-dicarboxylate transport system substrate-binding protein